MQQVNVATQTSYIHLVHLDKLQSEEDANDCASHKYVPLVLPAV